MKDFLERKQRKSIKYKEKKEHTVKYRKKKQARAMFYFERCF